MEKNSVISPAFEKEWTIAIEESPNSQGYDMKAGGSRSTGVEHIASDESESPSLIPSTKHASVERIRRWRQAVHTLTASHRFRYTLYLKKQDEERQQLRKRRARVIRLQAQVIRAVHLFKAAGQSRQDVESLIGSSENFAANENLSPVNVGQNDRNAARGRNCYTKMVFIERFFVVINFVLEIPTAIFDQLSYVHKPKYALISMVMASTILLICLLELAYTCRNERNTWRWSHKIFDMVGLVCAILQCVTAAIAYAFLSRHADNPIKFNIFPIIFSFGLLCSKFVKKNSNERELSTREVIADSSSRNLCA